MSLGVHPFIFLIMLILVSGCITPASPTPLSTAIVLSPVQTGAVNETTVPLTTRTSLLSEPAESPVPTLTLVSPSPTAQPTLTVAKAKEVILDLLKSNGGCQLPCLWGITPGITNMDSFNGSLSTFGEISVAKDVYIHSHSREQNGSITFILWNDNIRIPFVLSYYKDKEESIDHLTLSAQAGREEGQGVNQSIKAVYGEPFFYQILSYYLLPNILSTYGIPSDILIAPFPDDPDYPSDAKIPFSIVLFYQDKGIFVEYILPKEKIGKYLVGCPKKAGYLTVIVWPPDQHLSIEIVASMNSGLGMNTLNVDYFKAIENATEMTPEDFYQIFKNPNNTTCIETPKNIWH